MVIPKECKRLAEVDFPIAVVSKHAAREKSIRHSHPSTLHLWWARRPLASCRAMLMALLLPDPCDDHCPEDFKDAAQNILLSKPNRPSGWTNEIKTPEGLRKVLLKFIGDFANWDNSANKDYLETARALIKAAHPEETPLVVDPFAGGGSIPLEALRLGCETFASDLNPVACLILKVMLEDIPRWGRQKLKVKRQNGKEVKAKGLAETLRIVGKEIKEKAEKELAEFYPKDPDGATPIAYLWARTVKCESPNCGAEIPLMRSFWLCKKANRKRALRQKVIRPKNRPPHVEFEIFEPEEGKDVHGGTVTRAKATCLCCGTVLPPERVRTQLSEQHGGADVVFDSKGNFIGGANMLAVVTHQAGIQGRNYRLPTKQDYNAVWKAQKRLEAILDEWERGGKKGLCPLPDEPTPTINTHRAVGSQIPHYGITKFGDLFTRRQSLAVAVLSHEVSRSSRNTKMDISRLLSLAIGRVADATASLASWLASGEEIKHVFSRQALPMVWDFGETNPLSDVSRSWTSAINSIQKVVSAVDNASLDVGQVQQADACQHPLPSSSSPIWFTDPPYYDAIPYSNLSDFFLVWQRRALPNGIVSDPFDHKNTLSPKAQEAVQCEKTFDSVGRPKDSTFYETIMARAFGEGRRVLRNDGIGSVVFAHKTTEGWEALLSGMIKGGWTITGSWPIATEAGNRLNARETAALATSVHLVCRPRPENAPVGDWAEVLRELPSRVGNWMERLQGEGIRGADLVFACIGPALEIFSRYSRVETADGREVKLAEYLEKVWEVVGRMALEQVLGTEEAQARNGAASALEEDARLTALFLWTLQSTNGNGEGKNKKVKGKSAKEEIDKNEDEDAPRGKVKGYSLVFDVARRFAQPLGIDLPKWENRIIKTEKGVVRLLPVSERAKQLFGEEGAKSAADWIEQNPVKSLQMKLFPELEKLNPPKIRARGRGKIAIDPSGIDSDSMRQATTLDRVHAAMLLQAGGQTNALRSLIKAEQDRSPDFLRLANALSALYPKGSEEKRLLDAMLLAVPR
jgi:putative DNA methylase